VEEVVLTIGEVARRCGGRIVAPDHPGTLPAEEAPIRGAAAIAQAGEGEVTFFGNPKYLPQLKATRAACILIPEGTAAMLAGQAPPTACLVEVANPSVAFSRVLEAFAPPAVTTPAGIHPSAVIEEGVTLGREVAIAAHVVIETGTVIGDWTVIRANTTVGHGTRIGSDCVIHPNVTLRERSHLGDRVVIHSGTVIGSDGFGYELVDGRHVKIPQTGIVRIGDDVEIGANVTIDRARFGETRIGEGTKIDNLVQIAHNVETGKHCVIVSQVGISGSTRLGDYVTLAGQVGVVGHIEIGSQAVVAAQSGVSKSIPEKEVWWGCPATPIRETKEKMALINRLPKLSDRVRRLEELVEALSAELRGS